MSASDPMATVCQYIDGFNKGDPEAMASAFAVPGSILDGMAPHVWQGPTAAEDWYRDVLVEGGQHGASGYVVTLGEPLHNNITGDSAYVVIPATMTFKVRGKKVSKPARSLRWRIAALPKDGGSQHGPGPRANKPQMRAARGGLTASALALAVCCPCSARAIHSRQSVRTISP